VSSTLVALCYGSALLFAALLLWRFGAKSWYWHLLSLATALAVGLTPLPQALNTPQGTLGVGWVFVFLITCAVAAPIFVWMEHHPDLHHRPR
jgi:hypothetical protein